MAVLLPNLDSPTDLKLMFQYKCFPFQYISITEEHNKSNKYYNINKYTHYITL